MYQEDYLCLKKIIGGEMNLKLLCILVFLTGISLFAQEPDTVWTKIYGGVGDDSGYELAETADKGFIVIGNTSSFGAGDLDVWLLKIDSLGNKVWEKNYGGSGRERGYSIQPTSDGDYIVGAQTNSFGRGGFDIWILKINQEGDTIWTKTYGGTSQEEIYAVRELNDKGFIILGWTTSPEIGERKPWLLKTDSSGNIIWQNTIGTEQVMCSSLEITSDQNYLIAGTVLSGYPWLAKVNSSGDLIWEKIIYDNYGMGEAVIQNLEGDYILAAARFYDPNTSDIVIIRMDSSGSKIWDKTFDLSKFDQCNSLIQTNDRGYLANCVVSSGDKNNTDAELLKLSDSGEKQWTKVIAGKYQESITSIIISKENHYILCGETNSYSNGDYDLYLIKLSAEK